jgi:hypothetical protein
MASQDGAGQFKRDEELKKFVNIIAPNFGGKASSASQGVNQSAAGPNQPSNSGHCSTKKKKNSSTTKGQKDKDQSSATK